MGHGYAFSPGQFPLGRGRLAGSMRVGLPRRVTAVQHLTDFKYRQL